jgi:hypothetical protein
MEELLQALGLGTPVYVAAGTYGFFSWLDRNASSQAKHAIAQWLGGHEYERYGLQLGILSAFDRIYGKPLLSLRSFVRSALISIAVCVITRVLFAMYFGDAVVDQHPEVLSLYNKETNNQIILNIVIGLLPPVIFSDYISLFFVRRMLESKVLGPLKSCLLAFSCGIGAAFITYLLDLVVALFITGKFDVNFVADGLGYIFGLSIWDQLFWFAITMYPALLVHLWLIVFVVALSGMRLGYVMLHAVEWGGMAVEAGGTASLQGHRRHRSHARLYRGRAGKTGFAPALTGTIGALESHASQGHPPAMTAKPEANRQKRRYRKRHPEAAAGDLRKRGVARQNGDMMA